MAYISLSRNDINVLEKIRDPEADPTSAIVMDPSLPRDPSITEPSEYERVVAAERAIIRDIQLAEVAAAREETISSASLVACYREQLSKIDELIREFPKYASARNNRVQALRRLYGDGMLVEGCPIPSLLQNARLEERQAAGTKALEDLQVSLVLLSRTDQAAAMSPQAAKTLSLAHTQRAAIYLATSKLLATSHRLSVLDGRREEGWSVLEFEEAAARDFALGGRYGNEIAKGLAVSVNPTAKLCGQMVREAMKREYGPEYAS